MSNTETMIQEVTLPTTRKEIIRKSEFKAKIRGTIAPFEADSRKIKLNFADAKW